jgi:hypothetical protein
VTERGIMSKSNHYIDNKEFFSAMCDWKDKIKAAEDQGESKPPVNNYIGSCFMKIAERLAQKPNFAMYPYKEEMISDAIENCVMYAHNFNPEKSVNPFSYFTQIIYYAFLRRIEKEKKQSYIKLKLMEIHDDGTVSTWLKENYFEKNNDNETLREHFRLTKDDVDRLASKNKKKKGSTGPFE